MMFNKMNIKPCVLTCLFVTFLVSCSSLETIRISVQKPAQMTLPLDVRNITVVNNSISQPNSVGYISDQEETISVSNDSIGTILMQAFAQFMNEENFFDRVEYFEKPLRNDTSYLEEKLINPTVIRTITDATNADVIISLDRFITGSIFKKDYLFGYTTSNRLEIQMQAKFRIYTPEGKLMNYPILFEDTLYWDNRNNKIPTYRDALKQAALHTADKMVSMFIPIWQEQNRWIYSGNSAKMKQAVKEAKDNKWKEAAVIWGELWNEENKPLKKAKLASNIGIANEMLDDVENAFNWAKISYDLFYPERKKESVAEDFYRIEILKQELEQRANDLKKLSIQKGYN